SGGHFTRAGAVPPLTKRLLQDKGSVQELEGAAHAHRKQMFLSILLDEAQVRRLVGRFAGEWRQAATAWPGADVVLFDAVRLMLTRAASRWVGLPEDDAGLATLNRAFSAMVENAANYGPGG